MKVIKRDGSTVAFDRNKIVTAISKANKAVEEKERLGQEDIEEIASFVEHKNKKRLLVEDIQDMVEKQIMVRGHYELAKAYIIYRYNRALVRKANTTDDSILSLISNKNKDVMEENSNKNAVMVSTQRDLIAGEVSRDLTRRVVLPEKISKAHDLGEIHFHDADYFIQPMFNCCLVNLGDMLDNGTVMHGKLIESPKSFQVACTVMTQIIASVASAQYGGQSVDVSHLGKYLRRSREKFRKRLIETTHGQLPEEEMEAILDSRMKDELASGVQTISTRSTPDDHQRTVSLCDPVPAPGPQDEYIEENAQIIEEILRQRLEGIKNEVGVYVTPAFPKLVYVLDEFNCLKGRQVTNDVSWQSSVPSNGCIRTTFLPRRCGKSIRGTCSLPWAAGPSCLPGRTKRAIPSSKAGSTRGLCP